MLPLAGLRILAVDDNADVRMLVTAFLGAEGAVIVSAASAAEAQAELDGEARFDLLLSDIAMPDMDGVTLIREVRTSVRHATLPAIAYTAFENTQDRAALVAAGFDDLVGKSADLARLTDAVLALVARKGRVADPLDAADVQHAVEQQAAVEHVATVRPPPSPEEDEPDRTD